ncbi:aspartate/glutamate racemase family protein [Alcaligenaceae bacterium]|nr:aspartate/glutamate racemase family protein [Alcaligenaceae bacterium]
MDKNIKGPVVGVLGGMGPMAAAVFMCRLIALTPVRHDEEHIPAILWNDPRIPDRRLAYFHNGKDPMPWITHAIGHMQNAGAKVIAIPCNTVHLWYDQIVANSPIPVLHIVQAVIDDLHRKGIYSGRIGLMGTALTLQLGLYQGFLQAQGYTCIVLNDEQVHEHCSEPIRLVKLNRVEEAYQPAAVGVSLLKELGADAVILGCTELPIAVPHHRRSELGVPVIDSIDALALATLDWYQKQEKPQ